MNIRIAHQFFEESRMDRNFNDLHRRTRTEKVHALSTNLDFTKQMNEQVHLFYGIESIWNRVASKGSLKNIEDGTIGKSTARYPNADWFSMRLI